MPGRDNSAEAHKVWNNTEDQGPDGEGVRKDFDQVAYLDASLLTNLQVTLMTSYSQTPNVFIFLFLFSRDVRLHSMSAKAIDCSNDEIRRYTTPRYQCQRRQDHPVSR